MLPNHFCWTRFGTESGEDIMSILARKEQERQATGGMFLWGVGSSVGPAMRDLVRIEQQPRVVFSPMRSKPKPIDCTPSGVLHWTSAQDLNGNEWPLPAGTRVTSRQRSEGGREKRAHYALVCRSSMPLVAREEHRLIYEALVNLQTKNKLGASQVTAVVQLLKVAKQEGTAYPVALIAELVFPYFVRLENPVGLDIQRPKRDRKALHQQPLLSAA